MALRARLLAAKHVLEQHTGPGREALSQVQSSAFVEQLLREVPSLDAQQVADLSVVVLNVPWQEEHATRILGTLQGVVNGQKVTKLKKTRRKEQNFLSALGFMKQHQWNALLDKDVGIQAKMSTVIQAFSQLKCINPDAHTLKMMTSLFLQCAHGKTAAMTMSPLEKGVQKELVAKELKRNVRNLEVDDGQYLLVLPESPDRLLQVNPNMYHLLFNDILGFAVPCQVNENL